MWGGTISFVLRGRRVLCGLFVSLITLISSGCSQDMRRFDYPVFNLAAPSDAATPNLPADESAALPPSQR